AAVLDDEKLAGEATDVRQRFEEDVGLLDRAHVGVYASRRADVQPATLDERRSRDPRLLGSRTGREPLRHGHARSPCRGWQSQRGIRVRAWGRLNFRPRAVARRTAASRSLRSRPET